MKEQNNGVESRGLWSYDRIGRPVIMYDQRSKYNSSLDEFNLIMGERNKIGRSLLSIEQIGPIIIEEEL